jgi:hypothetical protein
MTNSPSVSSDRVLQILQGEPLGAALLRAAIAEATCEVLEQRVKELEQKPPADTPPGVTDRG